MYEVYLYFYDVIYKLQNSDKDSYVPNELEQYINEFILLQL